MVKFQYPTCKLKDLNKRYIVGKKKSGNYCRKTWGDVIYSMRNSLVGRFGWYAAHLKYEFSARKTFSHSHHVLFVFCSAYAQNVRTQRTTKVQWRWSCKVTYGYTVKCAWRVFSLGCDDDIDIVLAARAGRRLVQIAFFSTCPSVTCTREVWRLP